MNLFNYLKTQIPILQVIGEYTTLRQAGIYFKGICPFHSEKTPSFTVSPHREIFYCFGCHVGGDVIAFIAKVENYSPIEAAKFLAERFNLKIPKEVDKEFENINSDQKEKYYLICQKFAEFCHDSLYKSKIALTYLKNRGFNKAIIDSYNIGYFANGINNIKLLLKYMAKENFLAQDLIDANILFEGNVLYSPFEERIIFPIKDQLGRYCAFGGRIFKENDDRVKYYNSHENNFFNKGSILYGLDIAKKIIQKKKYAFLVEGYTDTIAMAQFGYNNCVATMGTACTIEQLRLLSRFTGLIYILYDGDQAGQKAILRLTEMCWNVNLELKVICLQDKEDPASFLFKNGNLNDLINAAKDIYSFFIESSGNNFSKKSLNEKIGAIKKVTDIIRNIDDPIKHDILVQEVANKLNVPFETIKKSLKTDFNNKAKQINLKNSIIKNKEEIETIDLQKRLFGTIMNNFDLFTPTYYHIMHFFNSPAKEILNSLIKLKEKSKSTINFDDLCNLIDPEQRNFVNKALLECDQDLSKNFKDMVMQFQRKIWKKFTQITKIKLDEAQRNSDTQMANKILNEFQELKKLVSGGLNNG